MFSHLKISKQLRGKLENELQPGEITRWIGQPVPQFFTVESAPFVLFGIAWTVMLLSQLGRPLTLTLWQIWRTFNSQHRLDLNMLLSVSALTFFLLIGFGLMSLPLQIWYFARNTVYLVTNQRAIVIEGSMFTMIRSYAPQQLQNFYSQRNPDGTGSIVLEMLFRPGHKPRRKEIGFLKIRHVREVEKLLEQLAQTAS